MPSLLSWFVVSLTVWAQTWWLQPSWMTWWNPQVEDGRAIGWERGSLSPDVMEPPLQLQTYYIYMRGKWASILFHSFIWTFWYAIIVWLWWFTHSSSLLPKDIPLYFYMGLPGDTRGVAGRRSDASLSGNASQKACVLLGSKSEAGRTTFFLSLIILEQF